MNGTEIATFIQNNLSTLVSPVTTLAGAVITAIFLRRNTATKTASEEFEKIKAGRLEEVTKELLDSGSMTYTEYYKMNNFLEIAKKADEIHHKMPKEEQSEPYNFDWFMRFYEATGTVSDEEMQNMWAKILAGEVCKQGSYSLRTLEALRNLSKPEAALFQNICRHSLEIDGKIFLPHYDEYLSAVCISYEDLMKMEECGLISSDGSI
ncbi:MAG: DUF2806 domain-containing protein, partial [Clostridiales bacterium]|nr:DUF2806 domain-containing protein [Clostridiales bacterium]